MRTLSARLHYTNTALERSLAKTYCSDKAKQSTEAANERRTQRGGQRGGGRTSNRRIEHVTRVIARHRIASRESPSGQWLWTSALFSVLSSSQVSSSDTRQSTRVSHARACACLLSSLQRRRNCMRALRSVRNRIESLSRARLGFQAERRLRAMSDPPPEGQSARALLASRRVASRSSLSSAQLAP